MKRADADRDGMVRGVPAIRLDWCRHPRRILDRCRRWPPRSSRSARRTSPALVPPLIGALAVGSSDIVLEIHGGPQTVALAHRILRAAFSWGDGRVVCACDQPARVQTGGITVLRSAGHSPVDRSACGAARRYRHASSDRFDLPTGLNANHLVFRRERRHYTGGSSSRARARFGLCAPSSRA